MWPYSDGCSGYARTSALIAKAAGHGCWSIISGDGPFQPLCLAANRGLSSIKLRRMEETTRSKIHSMADSLSRFRIYYFLGCFVAFVTLATLSYRGFDLSWANTLVFMWLFGIGFTVAKAHQLTDPKKDFGTAAYIFNVSIGALWWLFLVWSTFVIVTR